MGNDVKLLLIGFAIYLIVFLVPIFLYLKFKEKTNPFVFLRLKNNMLKNILKGAAFSTIYLIILVIKNIVLQKKSIDMNIGMMWLAVLLVGFFEEIPFRGFILQKLQKKMNFWNANITTTIIFVLLHFPNWIVSGTDMVSSIITVSMGSLVFGFLFKEYDTLWIPIMCHSVFNMTTWIGLK